MVNIRKLKVIDYETDSRRSSLQLSPKILESSDFEINFEEDNYDAGARDAVLDVTERAYIAGA